MYQLDVYGIAQPRNSSWNVIVRGMVDAFIHATSWHVYQKIRYLFLRSCKLGKEFDVSNSCFRENICPLKRCAGLFWLRSDPNYFLAVSRTNRRLHIVSFENLNKEQISFNQATYTYAEVLTDARSHGETFVQLKKMVPSSDHTISYGGITHKEKQIQMHLT